MSVSSNLVEMLEVDCLGAISPEAIARVANALETSLTLENVWAVLAVVGRRLPDERAVRAAHRRARSVGAADVVHAAARAGAKTGRAAEILRDSIVVDVAHTSTTELATGIQRVARETVKRWYAQHSMTLVAWTEDGTAMRRLVPAELDTTLNASPPSTSANRAANRRVIVPIGGIYLLPELAAESWRAPRVAALAQFASMSSAAIGFDCVPLTTAETVGLGMPGAFAGNLAAVAHMSKVGAISEAAATEYSGWREMLLPTGIRGPDIRNVLLAAEPQAATKVDHDDFSRIAELDDLPLVLVVGSHEPRKNHLAILQSAQMLWREGRQFRLVFVGGNSWNSLEFTDLVARLRASGAPIATLSALPDRLLWAAYRLARFTVFPSLNEGFGLPIAESISCGTPVVTSDFGSMKEIGAGNGALVVDSRDDGAIAAGMRSLLIDDDVYRRLVKQAANYRVRTWDEYARDLWSYFVEENQPSRPQLDS